MNKTTISVAVAVILLLGGGYMVYQGSNGPKKETPKQDTNTAQDTGQSKRSWKSILADGKSVKCTYTQTVASGTQNGTMYIANGHMRGDIMMSTASSGNYTMHMLNDGQWNYTWGGPIGESQGVKMKMMSETNVHTQANAQQGVDLNEQLDVNCSPWSEDSSEFVVPADIQFRDLSAGTMMNVNVNSMMNTSTSGSASANVNANVKVKAKVDCSVCNQAPEGMSRVQCMQALGCS